MVKCVNEIDIIYRRFRRFFWVLRRFVRLRRALFRPARPLVLRVDVVRDGEEDGRGEGLLFGDGDLFGGVGIRTRVPRLRLAAVVRYCRAYGFELGIIIYILII